MYRLTVQKFVENKEISAELMEHQKALDRFMNGYGDRHPVPPEIYLRGRTLTIDLTDEEFAAVKKAVLGVM